MAPKIRLDHAGMAEMLDSAKVSAAVEELGKSVADAVTLPAIKGPQEAEVKTTVRKASGGRLTSRTAVDVTLAHPSGVRVEAKHGTLAKAAASKGLEVRAK